MESSHNGRVFRSSLPCGVDPTCLFFLELLKPGNEEAASLDWNERSFLRVFLVFLLLNEKIKQKQEPIFNGTVLNCLLLPHFLGCTRLKNN